MKIEDFRLLISEGASIHGTGQDVSFAASFPLKIENLQSSIENQKLRSVEQNVGQVEYEYRQNVFAGKLPKRF